MSTAARVTRRAGDVRPFVEADIAHVAELHRRVFRTGDAPSAELEGGVGRRTEVNRA